MRTGFACVTHWPKREEPAFLTLRRTLRIADDVASTQEHTSLVSPNGEHTRRPRAQAARHSGNIGAAWALGRPELPPVGAKRPTGGERAQRVWKSR